MPVQTTKPSDYPQAVIQQIERLAQNIVIARKRRKETQAQWAKRLGVSQPTMARIERGDPAVAMASYVMCLWLINPTASVSDLIAPSQDTMALEHEVARAQARRPKRTTPKVSPVPMTRVDDMHHAGAVATLREEIKRADPMTQMREELRRADPMTQMREELKHAQTPTALGLAALLSKASGNTP